MLRREELKKQKTFSKYNDKQWFDSGMNFLLSFEIFNVPELYHYDESNGEKIFIKKIESLDDLENIYTAITNKNFEYVD